MSTVKIISTAIFLLYLLLVKSGNVSAVNDWTYAGLSPHDFNTIVIAPSNNNILYAADHIAGKRGVFKSNNGGATWTNITSDLPSEPDANSIAIDYTNPDVVYVGIYDKGVYKTTNGGTSWSTTGTITGTIRSIAIHPTNSNVVFVGTDGKLFKSTSGGNDWTQSAISLGSNIFMGIIFSKTNSNFILTAGGNGIGKSIDGGELWSQLTFGETADKAIAINPVNNDIMLAGKWSVGLYRSSDGGLTWSLVNNTSRYFTEISFDPNNSNLVYASSRNYGSFNGGLYKSTDGGSTWTNLTNNLPGTNIFSAVVNNSSRVFVGVANFGIYTYPGTISLPVSPIVFIPGHGGSWNWEGLIGDSDPATSEWTLAPWAKDYSNFLATLRNSGYTEQNKKLYVFNYNWRKPLDTRADRLNDYINNVVLADHPSAKIKLIGHSLGGLVARGYAQKYGTTQIDRLITVASPHEGAVDSYYAVSGGEIKKDNLLQRLAFELLLKTHQHNYTTNRDLVINEAPSSLDLLPIFDYLKKSGQNLSWQNMQAKNNWLTNLKNTLGSTLNGILTTVKGASFTTLRELTVSDATWEERARGLWLDGKPTGTIVNADGDGTVLGTSAGLGTQETLNYTHGELISSSDGIAKLLQLLDVSGTPVTTNSPLQNILVFILRSPATINIYDSQGKTPPGLNLINGKLAVLENPGSGDYQVQVKGTNQGDYSLDVGALTNTQGFWQEVKRPTDTQKRDHFTIDYSPNDPESTTIKDPTGLNNLRLAKEKLAKLRQGANGQTYRYLYESYRQLERAETLLVRVTPTRAYKEQALPFLESANEYLYRAYGEITPTDKLTTLDAAAHLIMLSYQTVAAAANKIPTQTISQTGLIAAQSAITLADAAAAATPPTGDKLTRSANLFSKAKEIYASAQTNHQNSKYAYAKLKFAGAKLLAEKTKTIINQ